MHRGSRSSRMASPSPPRRLSDWRAMRAVSSCAMTGTADHRSERSDPDDSTRTSAGAAASRSYVSLPRLCLAVHPRASHPALGTRWPDQTLESHDAVSPARSSHARGRLARSCRKYLLRLPCLPIRSARYARATRPTASRSIRALRYRIGTASVWTFRMPSACCIRWPPHLLRPSGNARPPIP